MLEDQRERQERPNVPVAELFLRQRGNADRIEPAAQVDRGRTTWKTAVDRLVEKLGEATDLLIRDVVDRSTGRDRIPVTGDGASSFADA